jgi:hypothetical protein
MAPAQQRERLREKSKVIVVIVVIVQSGERVHVGNQQIVMGGGRVYSVLNE